MEIDKIELERSEYIKQRQHYMKSLVVPKLSNAITTLGEPLAGIIFEECDEELVDYFGLQPPLKGAGDELWVSPSDLLIGKVVLKPPLTSKCIQALTHQGILNIGRDIEIKYWNEMEIEKEKALEEQKRILEEQFQIILENEIKEVELRECLACKRKLDQLAEEFEIALIEELLILETRLREEFEEYSRRQEERLRQEWERKLKLEVQKTVRRMTIEFLKELERQEAIMANNLKLELQKRDIQRQYDIGLEQLKCKEKMKQLKHNLECRNVANMMYILCMERRKCCEEKENIECYYKDEAKNLRNIIDQKNEQIQRLINERNRKIRELQLREACILEILREFQKFINFALRAAPTQAEFLLSIEKMMVFELADTVLKTNFARLIPCDKILPVLPPNTKRSVETGVIVEDHHDCLNELSPPRPAVYEYGSKEFLPAFTYKDKLYVREEFRDMVLHGIEISPSNELWNDDVEILIDILKKSVSKIVPQEEYTSGIGSSKKQSLTSNIHFESDGDSKKPKRISVDIEETTLSLSLSTKRQMYEKKASCKPQMNVVQGVDFEALGRMERHPTLIGTTNSLEILKKRGSVKPLKKEVDEDLADEDLEVKHSEEMTEYTMKSVESFKLSRHGQQDEEPDPSAIVIKEKTAEHKAGMKSPKLSVSSKRSGKDSLVLSARDSIILRKTSLMRKSTEFNVTPKDSIEVKKDSECALGKKPSKLVTSRNSIELLRESKQRIMDAPIPCPNRDCVNFKSRPDRTQKPSYSSKDVCCERCMRAKGSSDLLNGTIKSSKQSSFSKSIHLSHVEVISSDEPEKEQNVAFSGIPPAVFEVDTRPSHLMDNVSKIYKPRKPPKKPKDKFLNMPMVAKVLGDSEAKEYLQGTNEFTTHRIHSFLSLIKDHPNLIRTFTACTR